MKCSGENEVIQYTEIIDESSYNAIRELVQKQIPGTHKQWAERCVSLGASAAQIKPVHSLDNEEKKEFFLSKIQN